MISHYTDAKQEAEIVDQSRGVGVGGSTPAAPRFTHPLTAEPSPTMSMMPAGGHQQHTDLDVDASVRVVRIEKSSCEPLGATVKNEPDGSVLIGRIVKGTQRSAVRLIYYPTAGRALILVVNCD